MYRKTDRLSDLKQNASYHSSRRHTLEEPSLVDETKWRHTVNKAERSMSVNGTKEDNVSPGLTKGGKRQGNIRGLHQN